MTPRHSRRVSGARTRLSAGIGLASMLAPGIALAAANSAAVPTDLDAVVVTATASERSVERAPASVTVVSGEELRTAYRPTLQRFLTLQVQGADGRADRAVLATLRAALFARPPPTAAALAAALAVLTDTDLRPEVARIGVPTLVVTGSRDALTPAAAGAWRGLLRFVCHGPGTSRGRTERMVPDHEGAPFFFRVAFGRPPAAGRRRFTPSAPSGCPCRSAGPRAGDRSGPARSG